MWYWIIALIFFALELAAIAVIWRVCDIKNGVTTEPSDVFEVLHIILGFTLIGALVWPLVTLVVIFIILFNLYLKDIFDKIVDWVNEHL